jgi:hypothetical protein
VRLRTLKISESSCDGEIVKNSLWFCLYLAIVLVFAGCSAGHAGNPGIMVSVTGTPTTVTPSQVVNLGAIVTNDSSNAGVTWSLTGGGTFTSTTLSLTYTAPPTVPASPTVSVTATSITDPSQSASVTFTIAQSPALSEVSFLQGPYAFEMSGFASNGNALTLAGSFVADGNGGITSGVIDVNDGFAVNPPTAITGSYTLDPNLRGTITLNQGFSGFSDSPVFSFTLDSTTNTGNIAGADGESPAVSGPLASQSADVFSATPSGNFILRGSSDAGVRFGEVGRFTIGAGGGITAGLIDSADAFNGNHSQDAALFGSFAVADGAGRGQAILDAGSNSSNYVYYAVSPIKLFLIEVNPASTTQVLGVARGQSSLTAASVNGTGVFGLIGGDVADGSVFSSVAIGQAVISGGNTASISCDINDAGSSGQCTSSGGASIVPIPGTVTFDPTTGRGTITLPGGFDFGFVDLLVFYLEANGTGVLLDTTGIADASSSDSFPEALVGDLIPQTSTGNLVGRVQGVGLTSETNDASEVPAIVGEWSVDELGDINGLFDGTFAGNPPIINSVTASSLTESDSTGRSTPSINGALFNGPSVAFQVNPNQFFLIGEDSDVDSNLGVFTSQTVPEEAKMTKTNSSASRKRFASGAPKLARHEHHRSAGHSSVARVRIR